MERLRFASLWLGGCSGCHMSFLDMDEWLIDLAERVEVVYSPIADIKEYPENVDVALVEGSLANEDHIELIKKVRANTKVLISFGDCAITGNVTALRNMVGTAEQVLQRIYAEGAKPGAPVPNEPGIVPVLLDRVQPVHALVTVEMYLPGCPPPAPRIRALLEQMLAGETPHMAGREMLKFG